MKKLITIVTLFAVMLSLFACKAPSGNGKTAPLSVNEGSYSYIDEEKAEGAFVEAMRLTKEVYERAYKDDEYPNVLIYEENGETVYFYLWIIYSTEETEYSYDVCFKELKQNGNVFTATEIKTKLGGAEKLVLKFKDADRNGTFETLSFTLKVDGGADVTFNLKNNNTDFKTLFPDIKIESADQIEKATFTSWPGSIAPPWINKIWESTDEAYFQEIVDFIQSNPTYTNQNPNVGGGGVSLRITMKSGKEYKISGYQISVDGVDYHLEASIPRPDGDPNKYFMQIPSQTINFISYGEVTKVNPDFLSSVYYVKSEKTVDYIDFTKDALFDSGGSYLTVLSAKEFYFEGALYQVVSEADFRDYLPQKEDETCFLTILNGEEVYAKILVSKNQDYTVSELKEALSLTYARLYFEDGTNFSSVKISEDLTLKMEFTNY